ncbi:MAG TPA: site-specific integrase [Candidatus Coprosoma intestinipullorum]|uniref:Site-specific integrase n=1 Tax=Candidatus Coprosoma intestinipullorum TaxID=2840752 RepID=A0A9D0ZRV2_9FIRM|nr:site-specific integrase [Candidatus Coprosoma intestinipullorum]
MAVIQQKDKNKWTKDGRSWYFDVYYIDMYGNRKEKKSKYYKLRKEAKNAEMEFLSNNECNKTNNKNITLHSVIDEWLLWKSNTVKSTTAYWIELIVNKHITSYFSSQLKLQEITSNILTKWKDNLKKEQLCIKSQNRTIGYFKEILHFASDNYNFDYRITNQLQKYRVEKNHKQINDALINYWTYEQFEQFIKYVKERDNFYYVLFRFLYFTGVRFGEMAALTWNDIDFTKKTVKINKTLTTKIKGKDFDVLDPKTENSNRYIDLDDNLIELLKEHKSHESKIYNFNNDMFVFGNIKHIAYMTVQRRLKQYTKDSKVGKFITIHGFRHSHASFLINLGLDIRNVAERLGDTKDVIERTYYHMFPEKKSETINAINKYNLSRNLSR